MDSPVILVKNMVCRRCVLAIEDILQSESIDFHKVVIGEIHLHSGLSENQEERLKKRLLKIGFELFDNRTNAIIERIKNIVLKRARNEMNEDDRKIKLSHYLSDTLNHEYTYLSSLFSSVEGRTIENYFIEQRIEKAKELIIYDQLTLSEIASEMEYSSVAHLSRQFKKTTGLTPSHFKKIGNIKRKALDSI